MPRRWIKAERNQMLSRQNDRRTAENLKPESDVNTEHDRDGVVDNMGVGGVVWRWRTVWGRDGMGPVSYTHLTLPTIDDV